MALQAGVTYILHFTYAFYATCCSQHSHRSSSYTPISPLLLFYIFPIIAARVLTWLDLFLTSLVGFSSPCLLLLIFFFLFSLLPLVVCCQSQLPRFMKCNMPPPLPPVPVGQAGSTGWTSTLIYGAGQGCLPA